MKTSVFFGVMTILLTLLTPLSEASAESVSTSTTTSKSHTRVQITTNGETKVFESNGESIDYKSEDGKTRVRINSNGQNVQSNAQDTFDSVKQEVQGVVEENKKELEKKVEERKRETQNKVTNEVEKQSIGIIEVIKNFFAGLFNF